MNNIVGCESPQLLDLFYDYNPDNQVQQAGHSIFPLPSRQPPSPPSPPSSPRSSLEETPPPSPLPTRASPPPSPLSNYRFSSPIAEGEHVINTYNHPKPLNLCDLCEDLLIKDFY